jgi:hypothetical protein
MRAPRAAVHHSVLLIALVISREDPRPILGAAHDAFVSTVKAGEIRDKRGTVVENFDGTSPDEAAKRARETSVDACVPLTADILRTIVVETKDESV